MPRVGSPDRVPSGGPRRWFGSGPPRGPGRCSYRASSMCPTAFLDCRPTVRGWHRAGDRTLPSTRRRSMWVACAARSSGASRSSRATHCSRSPGRRRRRRCRHSWSRTTHRLRSSARAERRLRRRTASDVCAEPAVPVERARWQRTPEEPEGEEREGEERVPGLQPAGAGVTARAQVAPERPPLARARRRAGGTSRRSR